MYIERSRGQRVHERTGKFCNLQLVFLLQKHFLSLCFLNVGTLNISVHQHTVYTKFRENLACIWIAFYQVRYLSHLIIFPATLSQIVHVVSRHPV